MTLFGTRIPGLVLLIIGAILGFLAAKRGFTVPSPAPAV